MNQELRRVQVGVGSLIEYKGKYFLILRKRKHGRLTWSPPGGHINFGESPAKTAIRETKEEVGITASNPKFIGMTNDFFKSTKKHYITLWFKLKVKRPGKIKVQSKEVVSADWFFVNKLPKPLFLPFKNFIQRNGWLIYGR
ncbi:MAG: hypothetical protein A2729_04860 [Candidatus Buchananbacteria bacterium RIFCSPHIGHO2_01_FULL_39_14]|uniref:Nudix hydrolase domain-containing protein n=1 Tax=Candidatus Buchananbacteria bacterium RIFCSPHIGHO2_01_FULL_39_14 TaxID=1797532 RepID=A0A1G1XSA0_9BACT|nr:MAG: hypothetical protein A2729_04860 [Candidatus Buchananbacteria bacterium RIFCSPHIGHO2_01_FULL_39_14]OGY49586.1 MAG: hypothetical protein A3D39_02135 [Candidatus Buchananbacteria bacterium RIFCSPHIGHO2_02_FULL_39_17]